METDEALRALPFQLQFDKSVPSQIKLAEWNPEKDLLAMVTEDSKVLLHRFNWQRLWTISPGKCVTSLCWRPDGKAIAIGLEDGMISLHDVENGKLLRSMKSHAASVVCLTWEEDDGDQTRNEVGPVFSYEDRTSRFFPPAPRAPRLPTVVSGDPNIMDENEDSFWELLNSSHQHFNILCSAGADGSICFSVFGIFPIGEINLHKIPFRNPLWDKQVMHRILKPFIHKVGLSKDLCHLVTMCSGELEHDYAESRHEGLSDPGALGLHCLVMDTSMFWKRKNELNQVAQQATNVEHLTEVIRTSVSVMHKQWCDAMHTFHEKFNSLSTLIVSHGLDSSPQEEFLSLLGGARTSPPVHQFLVNSLGEAGLKRVTKVVCGAGKELQRIVLDHLQPAVEIIGFRMGELRGLSRWHARYGVLGLDEKLIDDATEKVGMLLVQVERFLRVLSSVVVQFSNFFNWLMKSIRILMSEPSDQIPSCNCELVIVFLRFLYDRDPVRQLLEQSSSDHSVEVDLDTARRVQGLVKLGGFTDTAYLQRTLAQQFQQMDFSIQEAFHMPYTTISEKIICQQLLPLFPFPSRISVISSNIPISISFYKNVPCEWDASAYQTCSEKLMGYISFRIPDGSLSDVSNYIVIVRGLRNEMMNGNECSISLEASILSTPDDFNCVDLSLYKEHQIVLLLNESTAAADSSENGQMMMVQASGLPFLPVSRSGPHFWKLYELKDSILHLALENEKARSIPHNVVPPLAVSSSRGVACVFAEKKRALVYILEEDEEDAPDVD
ncbi:Anaphase-promoting complex subunit 4 [Dionaea muscipula]